MKHKTVLTTLAALLVLWSMAVFAAVPQLINFQGILRDGSGNPVPNGVYTVRFRIYDDSTAGSVLWEETVPVATTSGLFSVRMGDGTALPSNLFSTGSSRFVCIKVNLDPELAPRTRLISVPYVYQALRSDSSSTATVALDLTCTGCVDATDLADNSVNSAKIADGSVGSADLADNSVNSAKILDGSIGNSDLADNSVNSAKILDGSILFGDIGPNGASANQVMKWNGSAWAAGNDDIGPASGWTDAGTTVQLTTGTDKVGIGITTPTKKLEVAGSIKVGAIDTVFTSNLSSNSPLRLQTGGTTRMVIDDASGNVGIGTASPSFQLSLKHDGVQDGLLMDSPIATIRILHTGVPKWEIANNAASVDKLTFYSYPMGLTVMTLQPDGNVGVGGAPISGTRFYVENSTGIDGVDAYGGTYGVYGSGGTTGGRFAGITGVYGFSNTSGGAAVYGDIGGNFGTYGGYFQGDVKIERNLVVVGSVFKGGGGFKIDDPIDPANKYLYHSFVESPDMKNIYDGVVTFDAKGEATVTLPDWFDKVNKDFRYQLTCIGGFAPVYVADKIKNNSFKIAGGTPGLEVSWQVTGIRKDPYAEVHRIPVEEAKTGKERGKYLLPEEYGVSKTLGINYEEEKQAKMDEERRRQARERARMEPERLNREQKVKENK